MSIKFTPIDNLNLSDSPNGLSVPEVTKEDKKWARRMKSSLKTNDDFAAETMTQIKSGHLRRVIWLTSQPYKVFRGDLSDRLFGGREHYRKGVMNLESFERFGLCAVEALVAEPTDVGRKVLEYCLYGVSKHGYMSHFLKNAVRTAIRAKAPIDLYDNILKGKVPDDSLIMVAIQENDFPVFEKLAQSSFEKDHSQSVAHLLTTALASEDDRYAEYIINEKPDYLSVETLSSCSVISTAVTSEKSDKWVDWCLDKGAPPDVVFYKALQNEKFEIANRVLEKFDVNLEALSTSLMDSAVSSKKEDIVEYLIEKGVNAGRAVEYVQEPRNATSDFSQKLREVFKKYAVNVRPVTWTLEDTSTIRRTVRTPTLETNWLFYFGEQTLIQFTKGRGSDDKLPATERMWQFSEFSNQGLIVEAKKALERIGGEAPDYEPQQTTLHKVAKLKSVKKP